MPTTNPKGVARGGGGAIRWKAWDEMDGGVWMGQTGGGRGGGRGGLRTYVPTYIPTCGRARVRA